MVKIQPETKIYSVVIGGQECGFFLEWKEDGKVYLTILDCGGMADMVPRCPEQLAWLEPRMEKIRGATRIWNTIWDLQTPAEVELVERMFQRDGQLSERQGSDYY